MMQEQIETKLKNALEPQHCVVENESHLHGGPATESHFKVTLVSPQFEGEPAVRRHQRVYGLLDDELRGGVHALALHLYTPGEWQADSRVPDSPDCRGGSA
ncbi:MAG: BolA/IbaG family iron-sulfur metabolism protein [Pseudohongiellaceae bacterium]